MTLNFSFHIQSFIGTWPCAFLYVLSTVLLCYNVELRSCDREQMALKALKIFSQVLLSKSLVTSALDQCFSNFAVHIELYGGGVSFKAFRTL